MQTFHRDLLILSSAESFGYNLFFAALSATVGFGHALWFWFQNPFSFRISRHWVQYISTYTIFWLLILLSLVLRMGFTLFFSLYNVAEYENQLSLYHELPILLMLLPLVIFLNLWVPIRLKYRSGNWFRISCLAFFVVTLILSLSSPIDQSHMNEVWRRKNASYDAIVDDELRIASYRGIAISNKVATETFRLNMPSYSKSSSFRYDVLTGSLLFWI